jgi:hypothetical protein
MARKRTKRDRIVRLLRRATRGDIGRIGSDPWLGAPHGSRPSVGIKEAAQDTVGPGRAWAVLQDRASEDQGQPLAGRGVAAKSGLAPKGDRHWFGFTSAWTAGASARDAL